MLNSVNSVPLRTPAVAGRLPVSLQSCDQAALEAALYTNKACLCANGFCRQQKSRDIPVIWVNQSTRVLWQFFENNNFWFDKITGKTNKTDKTTAFPLVLQMLRSVACHQDGRNMSRRSMEAQHRDLVTQCDGWLLMTGHFGDASNKNENTENETSRLRTLIGPFSRRFSFTWNCWLGPNFPRFSFEKLCRPHFLRVLPDWRRPGVKFRHGPYRCVDQWSNLWHVAGGLEVVLPGYHMGATNTSSGRHGAILPNRGRLSKPIKAVCHGPESQQLFHDSFSGESIDFSAMLSTLLQDSSPTGSSSA